MQAASSPVRSAQPQHPQQSTAIGPLQSVSHHGSHGSHQLAHGKTGALPAHFHVPAVNVPEPTAVPRGRRPDEGRPLDGRVRRPRQGRPDARGLLRDLVPAL